jgi:Lon protease-like protein
MSSSDAGSLPGFSGMARLFPLPNLVLFPAVIQPLHIFEPRYRQLMADALADDRLMALALLQPGWEDNYYQSPPIYPVVCLAKIFQEELLPDGRYNLLVQGMCRARVLEEVSSAKPYRRARVQPLRDVRLESAVSEHLLREELAEQLRAWFASQPAALRQLRKLLQTELPLGTLCDVFSFALDLESELKQRLLEEVDVERRARALLEHMEGKAAPEPETAERPFPPEFSVN